jgi:hypothetical protein
LIGAIDPETTVGGVAGTSDAEGEPGSLSGMVNTPISLVPHGIESLEGNHQRRPIALVTCWIIVLRM